MRPASAVFSTFLVLAAAPADAADSNGEFTAVLTAMRAGGPMRREDVVTRNGTVISREFVDVSPPDQMKRVVESVGVGGSKLFVSGNRAWIASTVNGRDEPAKEEGAAYAKSVLKNALGLEETNAPLIDCPTDGNETLTLIWKGEDSRKSVFNIAIVNAKTHLVKALNRSTLDKHDNTMFERKSTYTVIPAFTVNVTAR